jgi:pyruvate-formate lyase
MVTARVPPAALGVSPRVKQGLEALHASRLVDQELWGKGLTVLDASTIGLPLIRRKALAICKVLAEMPVRIADHELLVGDAVPGNNENFCEGRMGFPEYATKEEKRAAADVLSGPLSVFGHFCPSYYRYLAVGIGGLREIVEEKLANLRRAGAEPGKEAWYESVVLCLDGFGLLIGRYRDLSRSLVAGAETTPRGAELERIGEICGHLATEPPRDFREALQAVWFANAAFHSTLNLTPFGRLDQYLYPFLERDLAARRITVEQAQELVDLFWLKCSDRLKTFSLNERHLAEWTPSSSAYDIAQWTGAWGSTLGGVSTHDRVAMDGGTYTQLMQTVALGGVDRDGKDATNALTYLCLNAQLRLRLPQPSPYVRLHDESPDALYERVADCLRAGCVGPAVYCDETIVEGLREHGFPLEDAREYASSACFEPYVEGKTYFKYGIVSAAEAVSRVLMPDWWSAQKGPDFLAQYDPFRGGKLPSPSRYRAYGEIVSAVEHQLDLAVGGLVRTAVAMRDGRLFDIAPLPFLSAFMEGPLDEGRDITQNGAVYSQHSLLLVGLSHAADSLAVIKKLCFEDSVLRLPELLDALRSNWQKQEPLRQFVMTRVPAYGNDTDYADDIARGLADYFAQSVRRHSLLAANQCVFTPGIATFELYTGAGRLIPALPDGRKAWEPLSSNASPSLGRRLCGYTAALNSYFKLPLRRLPGGVCLDISMGLTPRQRRQVEPLLKAFVESRGHTMSLSFNDSKTLREAKKEPEKHRDLLVRVAGHQAYFVDLPPHHQDLLIQRSEQYAVGY